MKQKDILGQAEVQEQIERPLECFGNTVRKNDLGINYLIHLKLNI